ncbi:MAG: chorismate synthase [Anaerolineales bacterium]
MSLRFLTAGESHGPALTVILDGIPAGLSLDVSIIDLELARRQKGYGAGGRMKIEKDTVQILSGVLAGETIGAPIAMLVENADHVNWKNKAVEPMTKLRPGHADLIGVVKYGYRDLRPALERASARETAARTAVGAICRHFLNQFSIQVGGWVAAIGPVAMEREPLLEKTFADMIDRTEASEVRCPDPDTAGLMKEAIRQAKEDGDTLGGIIEVAVFGLPPGLGSYMHWDRKLDSRLGGAVLGIQAVKGVEIGSAFENAQKRGTEVQDSIRSRDDKLYRPTNRAGGLEGGVTNGCPLIIRAAMKPIATTLTPQQTVDLASKKECSSEYERSDFCPVPRAVPIVEAVVSYVLADALLEKLGGDSLSEMQPRFANLPQTRFSDLELDNQKHTWWPS